MPYLTDKDILERFEYYTVQLEELLLKGADFATITDQIPVAASLNHPDTFELVNTNPKHTEFSGYVPEEIRENWAEYIQTVHPSTIENILEFLPDFYKNQDHHKTMAFVQYSKLGRSSNFSPSISFTKPSQLPGGLLLWLTALPENFGEMSKKMDRIIKVDEFKFKKFKQFQQLTAREVEILTLLAQGHNNPAIAEQLYLSRQTVETHRKHLIYKLDIRSFLDLMKYAFAFGLVNI